jgi:hypothetical protein
MRPAGSELGRGVTLTLSHSLGQTL